jgi:hypothetical protein
LTNEHKGLKVNDAPLSQSLGISLFYFILWMYKCLVVYCRVPYLALAMTLEKIEGISGRLKIIEILANYFRSVIVLSPEDLLPSVYMCLNKLAPAYEGTFLTFYKSCLFFCLLNDAVYSCAVFVAFPYVSFLAHSENQLAFICVLYCGSPFQ